ncbi:MAG: alpha/beta hydrolase, partial [Sinobacteraceae bacterium]|nr:alpha/beta hydrolase [Nevskiaceae bacterium]
MICNPFGYEALCAHQTLRAFAEMAAELGIPALMFDYLGTGDSDDAAVGTDQFESWVRDTDAAVRALCSAAGVRQVCVLGLRIGATAAATAAARCPWITRLIAL